MSENYITRRKGMPTYPKVKSQGYEIWVAPGGIRRYFKCLPYLSGCTVTLSLSVKGLNPSKSVKYYWVLRRWDLDMRLVDPPVDSSCESDRKIEEIKGGSVVIFNKRLFINGKHTLHVWAEKDDHTFEEQVLCEFNIIDRDVFVINWIIGLLGVAIGALLTWLLPQIVNIFTVSENLTRNLK